MIYFLIILLAFFLANIPWFFNNFFIFFKLSKVKTIPLIFLEIIGYYFFIGIFVTFIEKQIIGNFHSQGWEFYVITFSIFMLFMYIKYFDNFF